MSSKKFGKPMILTEKSFESSPLACGKNHRQSFETRHRTSAFDTFQIILNQPASEIDSGEASIEIGFGGGGTPGPYAYFGLCGEWVTFTS